MIDTLKIAEDLESEGFASGQARKLAKVIASVGDDKRLRELEVKVGVQSVVGGIMAAALLAGFWQLYALRGEVSGLAAETRTRLGAVERKVDTVEQKIDTVERKVDAIEQKIDVLGQQIGALRAAIERPEAVPR